jgi:hypothetical protein
LSGWRVTPRQTIAIGLSLSTALAACLTVMALARISHTGWGFEPPPR